VEQPSAQAKHVNDKNKGILAIGLIFFLILFSAIGFVVGMEIHQKLTPKADEIKIQPTPSPVLENNYINQTATLPSTIYKGGEKIVGINKDEYDNNVARTGDWLIYTPQERNDYSVYARNIYTDKTSLVLSDTAVRDKLYKHLTALNKSTKNLNKEDPYRGYDKNLSKFRRDVIFRLNSYLEIGCLFKISLSDDTFKTSFYADEYNNMPNLVDVDGDTFFTLSFGDACAYGTTTNKLDYEKFIPTGAPFTTGYGTSADFIGYSKKENAYIFSEYKTETSPDIPCGMQTYLNLKGSKLNGGTIEYIKEGGLPDKTASFTVDNPSRKVYIITTSSLYYYDFENKKLVYVGKHTLANPDNKEGRFLYIDKVLPNGGLCVDGTLIDHTTGKTLNVNSDKCLTSTEYTAQSIFKSLDLPSNFTLKENSSGTF